MLWRLTALIAGLGLLLPAPVRPAVAQERLIVGTQLAISNAGLFVAASKGYFRDEGLVVDLRGFDDNNKLADILASGRLDLATLDFSAKIMTLAGNGAIKAVAGQARERAGFEGNNVVASVRAFTSGLHKLKDLAGRTWAITELGSVYHYQFGQIARANDFDLKAVTIKQYQTVENVAEAINNNRADAAVLPGPYARSMLTAGQARLVGWVSDVDEQQLGALFVSGRALEKNREAIVKFVRAYRRGASEFVADALRRDAFAKRILDARSRAMSELVGRFVFPKLDPEQARQAVQNWSYYIDPQVKLDLADLTKQVEWFKAQGLIERKIDPKLIADPQLVAAAK